MPESSTNQPSNQTAADQALSPELVKKVADKVYALWLREAQIEQERRRPINHKRRGPG
jgi:hypothetical protein